MAPHTGFIPDEVRTKTLNVLGQGLQDKIIMYENAEKLADAVLSAAKDELSASPSDVGVPVMSALFEIHPVFGSGAITLGYNKKKIRSARVLLSEVLNATARISNGKDFPHGLGCRYFPFVWHPDMVACTIKYLLMMCI